MSSLLFNAEVKQLLKLGLPHDMAMLVASARLEDKTIFNAQLERMQDDNLTIENELIKAGFKSSHDTIKDDANEVENIESRVDGGAEEQQLEK